MLDDSYMMKLMNVLSTATEFTIMVSFLQDKKNSASVICISKEHNRFSITVLCIAHVHIVDKHL